ncbi:hypothetical protein F8377_09870, partial [Corynebacterium zhongnanshanii]
MHEQTVDGSGKPTDPRDTSRRINHGGSEDNSSPGVVRDDAEASSSRAAEDAEVSGGTSGVGMLEGGHSSQGDVLAAVGGAVAVMMGAVGAVVARRRGTASDVWELGWVRPDGDRQRFMVVPDDSAPHEHRFEMDVPDGGRMIAREDGGVDVVDSSGAVVDHVQPPWAVDAMGRPVPTWYEVDNDQGVLVQKVAPDAQAVYPIVADPREKRGGVGQRRKTSPTSGSVVGPDAGDIVRRQRAQSGQRHTSSRKGPSQTRQAHTQARPQRSHRPSGQESATQQRRKDQQLPTRQPGFIGPVTAEDAAGQERNKRRAQHQAAQRRGRGIYTPEEEYQQAVTGRKLPVETTVHRGDQRAQHPVCEISAEGDAVTRNKDGFIDGVYPAGAPAGTDVIRHGDGSVTVVKGDRRTRYFPAPRSGSVGDRPVVESQTYDAGAGQTRQVFVRSDGTVVQQVQEGVQEISSPADGRVHVMPVATPGDPVVVGHGTPVKVHQLDHRAGAASDILLTQPIRQGDDVSTGGDDGGMDFGWSKSDTGTAIYGVANDTNFGLAEKSAEAVGGGADDVARAARIGGRALGVVGGVIGAESDRRAGMDATEAYTTNAIGTAAGIAAGA